MKLFVNALIVFALAAVLLAIPYFNGARNPLSWVYDLLVAIAFLVVVYIGYKPGKSIR